MPRTIRVKYGVYTTFPHSTSLAADITQRNSCSYYKCVLSRTPNASALHFSPYRTSRLSSAPYKLRKSRQPLLFDIASATQKPTASHGVQVLQPLIPDAYPIGLAPCNSSITPVRTNHHKKNTTGNTPFHLKQQTGQHHPTRTGLQKKQAALEACLPNTPRNTHPPLPAQYHHHTRQPSKRNTQTQQTQKASGRGRPQTRTARSPAHLTREASPQRAHPVRPAPGHPRRLRDVAVHLERAGGRHVVPTVGLEFSVRVVRFECRLVKLKLRLDALRERHTHKNTRTRGCYATSVGWYKIVPMDPRLFDNKSRMVCIAPMVQQDSCINVSSSVGRDTRKKTSPTLCSHGGRSPTEK